MNVSSDIVGNKSADQKGGSGSKEGWGPNGAVPGESWHRSQGG
jgi:hypothetical protein